MIVNVLTAIFCFSAVGVLQLAGPSRFLTLSEKKSDMLVPPRFVSQLTFGHDDAVADGFWLRLLQDVDVCGVAPDTIGPSLVERDWAQNPLSDALAGASRAARCEKGWSFQMLDVITDLAPRNYFPFAYGGPILSIIVDDKEGARIIFEKGVQHHPHRWQLAYRAAYHYLYEIGDAGRAAQLLTLAADNGAPSWTRILAARLFTREGQYAVGKAVLEDFIAQNPDSQFAEQARKRLAQLYAEYQASEARKADEVLQDKTQNKNEAQ
jgi:hypothetical protein